jgi:hypothetical protein
LEIGTSNFRRAPGAPDLANQFRTPKIVAPLIEEHDFPRRSLGLRFRFRAGLRLVLLG